MSESASDNPMSIEHSPIPGVSPLEYRQVQNAISEAQHDAHGIAYRQDPREQMGGDRRLFNTDEAAATKGDPNKDFIEQVYGKQTYVFTERLRTSEKPSALRWALREQLAVWELNSKVYSPYTAQHVLGILADREAAYKAADLTQAERDAIEFDKYTKLSVEEAKKLAEELTRLKKEMTARTRVKEYMDKHWGAVRDEKQAMQGLFFDGSQPETNDLKVIGNLGETLPGRERMGVMVDRSMRAWVQMARGELKSKRLEDDPDNPGMKRSVTLYPFTASMAKGTFDEMFGRVKEVAGADDASVNMGWTLLRILDIPTRFAVKGGGVPDRVMDVLRATGKVESLGKDKDGKEKYDIFCEPYKAILINRGDEGKPFKHETSNDTTGESSKAAELGPRALGQQVAPEYPFAATAPALAGVVPNLTADAFQILGYKIGEEYDPVTKKDVDVTSSAWEQWFENGTALGNLPWDESDETLPKFGLNVPYFLQKFYAFRVFEAMMREDYEKATSELSDPAYLQKLNKPFAVGLGLLWGNTEIGQKSWENKHHTVQKLIQLTKVNFLAAFVLATKNLDMDTGTDPYKKAKSYKELAGVPMTLQKAAISNKELQELVKLSAKVANFFSTRNRLNEEPKIVKIANGTELWKAEEELFDEIVTKRKMGIKPSALEGKWFSKEEIGAMNRVGVYYPFKA